MFRLLATPAHNTRGGVGGNVTKISGKKGRMKKDEGKMALERIKYIKKGDQKLRRKGCTMSQHVHIVGRGRTNFRSAREHAFRKRAIKTTNGFKPSVK
jgi:hypothetical protein